MLSIIYNGIKPNEYKFEYSVIDNNKVDYIDFSFNDRYEGTPFVKVESKDKKYVDKINVSEYFSNNHIIFPLLAKTTAHKVIRVQLSFETEETKWQTEVVEITLKNSVRADEEIANNYPTILDNIQKRLNHSDKKFVHLHSNFGNDEPSFSIELDEDVRVAYTVNDRKQSKGQKGKWLDTKKGNHITELVLSKGTYEFYDLINLFLGETINEYNEFPYEEIEMRKEKQYDFPHNISCCAVCWSWIAENIKTIGIGTIGKSFNKWYKKYFDESQKQCLTFSRIQFKFIKDFKWRSENSERGWKGTIADAYIDCLCVIKGGSGYDSFDIYFYPRPRRF